MNIGALAGLAGVPRGEQIGADARASNALKALQIKAAQRQMEDADQQRKAQEFAFGILSGGDVGQLGQPMPQLPQAPGPQSPMPGQASVPMIHPGMADPSMPMPSPAAPPPVAGAAPSPTPTPGGGAPPMQAPPGAMPGGQAGAMPGGMGQYDIRTLAQRIKQENPGADPRVLFKTLVEADKLLNPQAKMELQMLIGQMKADALMQKMDATFALQGEKLRSQEERAKEQRDLLKQISDAKLQAQDERTKIQLQAMEDRMNAKLNADAEKLRITEEGKNKRAEDKAAILKAPPVGAAEKMTEILDMERTVSTTLRGLEATPDAVGWGKGAINALPIGDKINNYLDENGAMTRAGVANINSALLKLRSGAAVTVPEYQRLLPFVPQIGDPPNIVREKLTEMKRLLTETLKDRYTVHGPSKGFQQNERIEEVLAGGGTPGGAAPVKVSTPEEAAKLPSGTRIILPDGSPGVVP